jgi:hypothetical protein
VKIYVLLVKKTIKNESTNTIIINERRVAYRNMTYKAGKAEKL